MSFSKLDFLTDNKPISLSVKDWIIRKMAVKLMMNEKTIETVVNHQFQEANDALLRNNSLEISGFGRFVFNEKKAIKMLAKYESQKALFEKWVEDPERQNKRAANQAKLQTALDGIRDLKPKLYENRTDLRGLEEQPAASQEVEEGDSNGEQAENGNLQSMSPQFPE